MKVPRKNILSSGLKGSVLLLTFLAMVVLSNTTFAQESSQTRLEAAERYAKVFNLPKMMNETVAQIALQVPQNRRDEFIQFMSQALDMEMLENLITTSMVQHFTTNELNALADFYGSPEGISIVEKMPAYMASTMPRIQAEVLKTAEKF
ncbi:DUF2059 domain-containing protein [Thalassospira sp. SM2505]